jgi:hypothetical protein
VPFSYYKRLSAADKRVYRKSDEIRTVALPSPSALHARVASLQHALESGQQRATGKAAQELVDGITDALGVPRVSVTVRSVRPSNSSGELHGYYTLEEGKTATIEVWMRTAAHERVVAFRTFLRTLLHEVCHHLDFTLFELTETFHTEGFFRRESSLTRQLLGRAPTPPRERAPESDRPAPAPKAPKAPPQLELPFGPRPR